MCWSLPWYGGKPCRHDDQDTTGNLQLFEQVWTSSTWLKTPHSYMGVSLNGGTQQPWVFLLKMIILGCFGDTTIEGNTHIHHIYSVVPNQKNIFPEFERLLRCFRGHHSASLSQPREWNINEFSGRLKAYPAFLKDKIYTTNARKHTIYFHYQQSG